MEKVKKRLCPSCVKDAANGYRPPHMFFHQSDVMSLQVTRDAFERARSSFKGVKVYTPIFFGTAGEACYGGIDLSDPESESVGVISQMNPLTEIDNSPVTVERIFNAMEEIYKLENK